MPRSAWGITASWAKTPAFVCGTSIYGSCRFGAHSYVATSIIRNQVQVEEGGFVGMGSVVVRDVPAYTTVAGNPAKPFDKKKEG